MASHVVTHGFSGWRRHLAAACGVLGIASVASAQAWTYPAFQAPRLEEREFNFGVADAGKGGTTLIAQWREFVASRSQFTLEAGLSAADKGGGNVLIGAASLAYEAHRATSEVPLDLILTGGAGVALGDAQALRIPAGVAVGYRIELERDVAITPYLHPRLSIDFCNDCGRDDAALGVNFDVGVNVDVSPHIAIRAAAMFGGGSLFGQDGIGISLAWRPPGLRR